MLLAPSAKVSVVGLRHFDGVEEKWKHIQDLVKRLRNEWIESMGLAKDYVNGFGQSLTWLCAFYGHDAVFDRLGNAVCNINRVNPLDGSTPLMVAVQRSHVNVVRNLLTLKADQHIPDFSLNLPLHMVQDSVIAKLLDYHEKKNASGLTALESSVTHGVISVTEVLLERAQDVSFTKLLFLGCHCKSSKMIQFLLSRKCVSQADLLSLRDEQGNTLLMRTVTLSNYELFKFVGSLLGWDNIEWNHSNFDGNDIFKLSATINNVGIQRKLEKIQRDFK